MSDEYGALTMVLLRLFAFPAAGAPAPAPRPARPQPLRAPAPPALVVKAPPPVVEAAPADAALGERWNAIVTSLVQAGAVTALTRELAWQAGLLGIDESAQPPRWRLRVERETLRAPALADRLAAALVDALGTPLQVALEAGTPADSPALREAAERLRRQRDAEAAVQSDPLVRELLARFQGAQIVPGSIQPLSKDPTP